MARGRFLSKSLSTSECFAKLHEQVPDIAEFCQALYPLLIAHSDDYGRQAGDPFTVKLAVYPTSPRPLDDFSKALQALHDVTLIHWYAVQGKRYVQIRDFDPHQLGLHKRTTARIPAPQSSGNLPEVPGMSGNTAEPPGISRLREEKRREEKKDLTHHHGEVRSGGPKEAPAPAPVLRDPARRPHPLEEPPVTTLSAESLAALDAFTRTYPNRSAPPRAVHRAWLELNPSPLLAERILRDLDDRLARGWGSKTAEIRFLPKATTWLRDHHWTTPLPDHEGPPPARDVEGLACETTCDDCGERLRGEIKQGAAVYPAHACRAVKALTGTR